MLKGLLVANAFLRTEKFVEHYQWLEEAAGRRNIVLSLFDNAGLLSVVGKDGSAIKRIAGEYDFVIFWDKDIRQGKQLEWECRRRGVPVFNSIDAVAACDDKFETCLRLARWNEEAAPEEKIAMPATIAAPMTYENIGYTSLGFVDRVIGELGLPLVVKECFGSFGMQVYLAPSRQEVLALTERLAGKPFLYQEYLAASSGRDVRLEVVGNRVVAGMYRFSGTGDFRANITNGGSMRPYSPSVREQALALRAARALGLDFAGVDLLFSEEKEALVVCEVNSNAHFKNMYLCTGVNVAEEIMEYIVQKVGDREGMGSNGRKCEEMCVSYLPGERSRKK